MKVPPVYSSGLSCLALAFPTSSFHCFDRPNRLIMLAFWSDPREVIMDGRGGEGHRLKRCDTCRTSVGALYNTVRMPGQREEIIVFAFWMMPKARLVWGDRELGTREINALTISDTRQ